MRTTRPTRSALIAQQQWQAGHPAASARRPYRRSLPVARVARWALVVVAVLVALPYTGLV